MDPDGLLAELAEEYPERIIREADLDAALAGGWPGVYAGFRERAWPQTWLVLRPQNLVAGVGCHPGVAADEILRFLQDSFKKERLSLASLKALASIEARKGEPGLKEAAARLGVEFLWFTKEELQSVPVPTPSPQVIRLVGVVSVAEAAALKAGGRDLVLTKRKGATSPWRWPVPGTLDGGESGPGFPDYIIPRARAALAEAQVVAGYRTYVELLQPLLTHQEVVATGMKGEMERCQMAIDRALLGTRVALVSGGDAGIYGMAGLVLEICAARGLKIGPPEGGEEEVDFHLEVIPGVPALAAGAALLGAPLMHDFAAISLSDLLTPWETIQRRLELAAQGDFVIVLYNPKSKKRHWQLAAVRELLLRFKDPGTPVGLVGRAMRPGQESVITSLKELLAYPVDMQTVIIVGSSRTFTYGPYMITPRGYLDKYQVKEGQER